MSLKIVKQYFGRDPLVVLREHGDWDTVPHEAWIAYHSLHVLEDPAYLKFVTDKLTRYLTGALRWASAMSAATAADMHRDCDVTSPESVVEHMSRLTLEQLEIVGI
jgi:hypothetical protein